MSDTKVITGKVRFSYAEVFEPKAVKDGPLKYSVSLIIDKKDKITLAKIADAVEAALEQGKSMWGNRTQKNLKLPLRDGDEDREDDEAYVGAMFVNASSNSKPSIVDADLEKLMDKEEFYSGCYGRASVNFYPFNHSGSKGVACGLNNLQKLEDGEALAGGATAEEDFGDDSLM